MMVRRQFLALMAAAPVMGKVPVRDAGRVETVFKTPGPHPNGLQATEEGLWIIDGDDGRVFLVRYEDGRVLRDFETESVGPSGITFDGEAIWIASTYSREIIRADASNGKTMAKFFTPGAGVIYKMPSDPPNTAESARTPSGAFAERAARACCLRCQSPCRNRRSRSRMAGRQALDGGPAVTNDLPHRSRELDRRAAFPNLRQPSPWDRLGREIPVVRGHQPERLLQARSRHRQDRREDPTRGRRPDTSWDVHPGRRPVVLRRCGRCLPVENLGGGAWRGDIPVPHSSFPIRHARILSCLNLLWEFGG